VVPDGTPSGSATLMVWSPILSSDSPSAP
jgi:hypothetical protein